MKFMEALEAMKEGKTLSRRGLDRFSARLSDDDNPYFQSIVWFIGDLNNVAGFVSVSDYDSDEWYIVEEGCGDAVPANEEA